MKTAVEFLIKEFSDILGPIETTVTGNLLLVDAIKRAKEMEKEQMRSDFWHHRRITGYEILKDKVETFKQEQ
jgi:hypothetical protein